MKQPKPSEDTHERKEQINRILAEAMARSEPDRQAFLKNVCAGDEVLLQEVELRLAHNDEATVSLVIPAIDPASARSTLVASEVLANRFEIVRLIGQGGMGDVYEALDIQLSER